MQYTINLNYYVFFLIVLFFQDYILRILILRIIKILLKDFLLINYDFIINNLNNYTSSMI